MAGNSALGKGVGLGVLNDYDEIELLLQGITTALKNQDQKQGRTDALLNAKDLGIKLKKAQKDAKLLHKILKKNVLPLVLKEKEK